MLSTRGLAAATASVRIKSLDSRLVQDDQKDLEAETEEQSEELANGQAEVETEEQSEAEIEAEQSTHSGLSLRASGIKEYLREKTSVKAVLLKKDGSTEEISYDASSSGTRSLLGGRASIVGEIEDLKAVVVQSVEHSQGGSANQHTLPVPLCHNKGQSDYVLFRVDSVGKAGDIGLEEYQKYVDDHKTLTATAVKQRNFDEEPIRSNSPFEATSEISMKSLRGALQTQLYDELTSAVDADPERNDAEIEEAVNQQLQKIVDDAVTAFSASPMEDPDYDPEEEGLDEEAELEVVGSGYSLSTDDRPWRMQLDDALDHIKEVGRAHGEAFAEGIAATFYEVNGEEPSLEALSSLYDRIRTDFANEAEEELEDEEQSEAEAESEVESEEEMDFGDEWDDALDHIRSIGRKDGRCLAQNVCDLFNDVNGAEPSLSELHELWQSIQDGLAQEAAEQDLEEEGSSDDEEDEDAAYSPSNPKDSALASEDLAEDRKHDLEYFDLTMLNTPAVSSKRGGGVSWSVFFDESQLNEEAESSNLVKSVESFKMRNQREPTQVEVHRMKQFLSVPNELVDEEEAMADGATMTRSAIAKTGSGASWSVDFSESSGSLKNAVKAFERMHNREPTSFERDQIHAFIHGYILKFNRRPTFDSDRVQLDDVKQSEIVAPAEFTSKALVTKKAATGYTLQFDDGEEQQNGDEEEAIKWFKRFNGREPDSEERQNIDQFHSATVIEKHGSNLKIRNEGPSEHGMSMISKFSQLAEAGSISKRRDLFKVEMRNDDGPWERVCDDSTVRIYKLNHILTVNISQSPPYVLHFRHTVPYHKSRLEFNDDPKNSWCSWHVVQGDLIQNLGPFDVRVHFKQQCDLITFHNLFHKIVHCLDEFSINTPGGHEAISIIAGTNQLFQKSRRHRHEETIGRPLDIGIGLSNEVELFHVDENAEEQYFGHDPNGHRDPNGYIQAEPSAYDVDRVKAFNEEQQLNGRKQEVEDHAFALNQQQNEHRIQSQKENLALQHELESVIFELEQTRRDLESKTAEMEQQQRHFEGENSRITAERDDLRRILSEKEQSHQMERNEMKQVLDRITKEKEQLKKKYKVATNDCHEMSVELQKLKAAATVKPKLIKMKVDQSAQDRERVLKGRNLELEAQCKELDTRRTSITWNLSCAGAQRTLERGWNFY